MSPWSFIRALWALAAEERPLPPLSGIHLRAGGLGPNQIRWADKELPSFKGARKGADAALADTERSKQRHGGTNT